MFDLHRLRIVRTRMTSLVCRSRAISNLRAYRFTELTVSLFVYAFSCRTLERNSKKSRYGQSMPLFVSLSALNSFLINP
ncbi:unnamed protein product [Gongylonema pulchrum]|uniref:Uncharacterized protein n=1 Tax=Gongylonema pulchrum TaxID=637853 RepID=A0A183DSZ1_9BILA|nr:unnamed protein product [Gongylonema pulchrum]